MHASPPHIRPPLSEFHTMLRTSDTTESARDVFETFVSKKALGCIVRKSGTTFRLFAPRATHVTLVLFDRFDEEHGVRLPMTRGEDGIWEHVAPGALYGKFYGYQVAGPLGPGEMFDSTVVIADPYSRAVVSHNHYRQQSKTIILDERYDWEGDTWVAPDDPSSLVIYEAHLRDLTAHASSGVRAGGTYAGLLERGRSGGLAHLKELGINAVEFLPLQKFGVIEIPYRDSNTVDDNGEYNIWNPYERNHWGYMTSYFFAPESYYASDGSARLGSYSGHAGRAVTELKDLVKGLHREKIAVIMDVVYNHVSQYDYNPFKYIDKKYYFRLDAQGNFIKHSGCGNDFRTEQPMARRLILDSVRYWMEEYHIDGFRFDLATLIDRETCRAIIGEARKINPNVVIIAEPWGGGGYDPSGFSDMGWASWNDRFRNGMKGRNPHDALGFIFGKFHDGNSKETIKSYLTGTLREDGGMYLKKEHSVNYLESHDNYTLGDFIRLATGDVRPSDVITDLDAHAALSSRQMALHKLAALALFSSQGPVMVHEGQEFARSKVIVPGNAPDPHTGTIDHNSYNKDNETNYLNYGHRDLNRQLVEYYRALIRLRRAYPALANAPAKALSFLETNDDYFLAFIINGSTARTRKGSRPLIVLLNGNPHAPGSITLPAGSWRVLADGTSVDADGLGTALSGAVSVPPTSGMILVQ